MNDWTSEYLKSAYKLQAIDTIKLNKKKLCEMYNASDIDALEYMYPFCVGELKELCERLITLNNETTLGFGREDYTEDEALEYFDGKWKLLNYFGVVSDNGDAIVKGE